MTATLNGDFAAWASARNGHTAVAAAAAAEPQRNDRREDSDMRTLRTTCRYQHKSSPCLASQGNIEFRCGNKAAVDDMQNSGNAFRVVGDQVQRGPCNILRTEN